MSDSSIPAYADSRKIFQQEENISGILDLGRLPRFRKTLANDQGSVSLELKFSLSDEKKRLIEGRLQAQVNVFCQRCLKPLAIELADDIKLVLVQDEEAAQRLGADMDPWICEDYKLDLAELVEEQLILCTPIVSYHDSGDCIHQQHYVAGENATENVTNDNPFSVLRSLKESDSSD
ncbi:MAG: DUF177 domain-containing protein [Gammaproteobacteria bacterium]|nr:DUF177 domain-containing protein [Gammaproteobacteria bacterium]